MVMGSQKVSETEFGGRVLMWATQLKFEESALAGEAQDYFQIGTMPSDLA